MAFNLIDTDNVRDNATLHLARGQGATSAVVGDTTYLFTSSQSESGVSVFSIDTNGILTNVANVSDDATLNIAGAGALTTGVAGGTTYLYVAGEYAYGISGFSVGADGALTNVANVGDNATLALQEVDCLTTAVVGDTTYLFAGGFSDGVSAFSVGAAGALTNVTNVHDSSSTEISGTTAVTTAVVGGTTYLFVAGHYEGVSVFSVGADGALTHVTNGGPSSGRALATAEVGGITYLFIQLSSYYPGVSVFSVSVDGSLTGVATVSDNATLHLGGYDGSFTTMAIAGTTYLLSGSDDGVSAFAIGNDGALTNVQNIADNATLYIDGAFVTSSTVAGVPYLFAQGHFDSGVSAFRYDPNPSVAKDDSFATTENAAVGGTSNVFADNGAGADNDPDNDPFVVTAVRGSAAAVGQQITLPSGAHVTLGTNGDLAYDPNHAFDYLPAPGSGASNISAVDTFTYAITGGDTATVSVAITGIDSDDILRDSPGIDNLTGGVGNDRYYVGNASDVVNEAVGGGNDRVFASVSYALAAGQEIETLSTDNNAGTGPINLTGNEFDNTLIGNRGDNLLAPGAGSDIVSGFGGSDTIDYAHAAGGVFVYLDYHDAVGAVDEGSAGASFRNGASGVTVASTDYLVDISNAVGSPFDDRIYGTTGDNLIRPGSGADVVDGLGGSDTIDYSDAAGGVFAYLDYGGGIGAVDEGAAGASFRNGAAGVTVAATDILVDISNAIGSLFDDRIYGPDSGSTLNGGGGNDVIYGGAGGDQLNGGNGDDTLVGRGGDDTLIGGGGNDTIAYGDAAGGVYVNLDSGNGIGSVYEGAVGASFYNGLAGVTVASTDTVIHIANVSGSAFDDRIYGTAGDNLIASGAGADVVYGRGGSDTIDYAGAAGGVFIDLDYGSGIGAVYEGTAGASFRNGAAGVALASTDVLVAIANANGSAFDDRINGAAAGGALSGGGGDDVIYGAAGADRLNGGDGNDILIGRGGSDIFVFGAALSAAGNVDQIVDFTPSTGAPAEVDAIHLDHAIFGALPVGALAAAAFTTGAPTTTDQHIIYDATTGALSYDDDGNGVHAATQFAALITLPAGVSAADFLVI